MINLIPADVVYMIRRKDLHDPTFFLYDSIDLQYTEAVLWTPSQYKAREFYSEESVETYLYEKLKQRPCEIIMVK